MDDRDRPGYGALLREWRRRRRVSQLDLALAADVSARHVSFLETGRSRPSREMVLRLAERLEVPLRDRNPLLLAAGFAPSYPQRPFEDPALSPVRDAVAAILTGYEPYPALAVDRGWNLVAANAGVAALTTPAAPELSFLSTVTAFGTALDITAAELSIEAFLPADRATAAALVQG